MTADDLRGQWVKGGRRGGDLLCSTVKKTGTRFLKALREWVPASPCRPVAMDWKIPLLPELASVYPESLPFSWAPRSWCEPEFQKPEGKGPAGPSTAVLHPSAPCGGAESRQTLEALGVREQTGAGVGGGGADMAHVYSGM